MYKADIRIDESVLTENRKFQHDAGVKPKPIRKKGYHRALKRKEFWAVNQSFLESLNKAAEKLINMYDESKEIKIIGLSRILRTNDTPLYSNPSHPTDLS